MTLTGPTTTRVQGRVVDIAFTEVRWVGPDPFDYEETDVTEGKWAYVFVDLAGGGREVREVHFGAGGQFRQVDWADRTWEGVDDRPADRPSTAGAGGGRVLRLLLPDGFVRVSAFLSGEQLTRARLETYRTPGERALAYRALGIPADHLARDLDDEDPADTMVGDATHHWDDGRRAVVLALPDHLAIAQQVHTLGYAPAVDEYAGFLAQTEVAHLHATTTLQVAESYEAAAQESWWTRTVVRGIEGAAEWVAQPVTGRPPDTTVWDWISKRRLEATLSSWADRAGPLRDRADALGRELYVRWMSHPAYEVAAFDAVAGPVERGDESSDPSFVDELLVQSGLLHDAPQSKAGREYLDVLFGRRTALDGGLAGLAEAPTWHDAVFFLSVDALRRTSDVVADGLLNRQVGIGRDITGTNDQLNSVEDKLRRVFDNYREALAAEATRARRLTQSLAEAEAHLAKWGRLDRLLGGVVRRVEPALAAAPAGGGLQAVQQRVRAAGAALFQRVRDAVIDPPLPKARGRVTDVLGEFEKMGDHLRDLRGKARGEEETLSRTRRNLRNRRWELQRKDLGIEGQRVDGARFVLGLHLFNLVLNAHHWREVKQKQSGGGWTGEEAQAAIGTATALTESLATFRHYAFSNAAQGALRQQAYAILRAVNVLALVLEGVYQGVSAVVAFQRGDTGRAVGHVVSFVSALALFVTGYAVIPLILGQVIGAVWGDDELEQWFKHSHWGKWRFREEGSLEEQLDLLFSLLLRPRVYAQLLDADGQFAEAPNAFERRTYEGPATLVVTVEPTLFDPGFMTLEVDRLAMPAGWTPSFEAVDLVPRVLEPDRPRPAPTPFPPPDPVEVPPYDPLAPSSVLDLVRPLPLDAPRRPLYPAPEPREDYDLTDDGTIARFEWRWDLREMDRHPRRMLADALSDPVTFAALECDLLVRVRGVGEYETGFRLRYRGLPAYIGPPPPPGWPTMGRHRWVQRPIGGELGVQERTALSRR